MHAYLRIQQVMLRAVGSGRAHSERRAPPTMEIPHASLQSAHTPHIGHQMCVQACMCAHVYLCRRASACVCVVCVRVLVGPYIIKFYMKLINIIPKTVNAIVSQ